MASLSIGKGWGVGRHGGTQQQKATQTGMTASNPDWNDSQLRAGPLSFPHSFFLSEKLKKQEEKDRGKPAEVLSSHTPEQGPGTC